MPGSLVREGEWLGCSRERLSPWACRCEGAGYSFPVTRKQFANAKFESVRVTPLIVFVSKVSPILTAYPNPVPAGDAKGRTTISWNALGESASKVYVSMNGAEESLFAVGREGSSDANWIETGPSYEFRLYNSDHTKVLDKIIVTRAKQ